MRITTAVSAIALAAVIGFASTALAGKAKSDGDAKVKVKKVEKNDEVTWSRGEWTERQRVTVRTEDGWREVQDRPGRPIESGMVLHRQFSGPYRYFFTDHEGKYNYYLDRYEYPFQYGQRETPLPVGVLGFVPPEQMGGGPVLYFRPERPLSRSVFDGPRGPRE
jgi:hypothetical protein